ncbi:unnamed protein product [Aureobasidium pullulans]|nr:unnamed protein product [Aureobasidium pullulans]
MDFRVGANPSTEPGQPHTAQSDNARSPSPEETPDITPLCKLTAEEAEHDYQKQLTLLAEQTAHHDAQRASEPPLEQQTQQIRLLELQVERQREVLGTATPKPWEPLTSSVWNINSMDNWKKQRNCNGGSSTPEVDTWASHTPTLCAVCSI